MQNMRCVPLLLLTSLLVCPLAVGEQTISLRLPDRKAASVASPHNPPNDTRRSRCTFYQAQREKLLLALQTQPASQDFLDRQLKRNGRELAAYCD